jgi:ABC-type nickel/cobalt efflux system permease component RcnA
VRTWAFLLGGLVVWTVHFFALYIVGSVWHSTLLARGLTLAITIGCLAAVIIQYLSVRRIQREAEMDKWGRTVALAGLGVAGIAVIWQGLPALLA